MICLFVCLFFFMLKLLQYCNYIIIVMQIKLMLLLLDLSSSSSSLISPSGLVVMATYMTYHG